MRKKIKILLLLCLVLAGIQIGLQANYTQSLQNPCAKTGCEALSYPKPSKVPIVASSPTPKSAPTPVSKPVYYGYCLNVPVLFYHHIQPQAQAIINKQTSESVDTAYFDSQMAYLVQRGYTSISALDLVIALRNHTGLPPRSIVVTIDDGYADTYSNAYPILRKYGIKMSFLIPSGLIGNPGFMNWDQVNEMKNSGLVSLVNHTWSHYSLDRGPLEKVKFEIETAKSQIQQFTGVDTQVFGYPYGAFNNTVIQVLKDDGFLGAFTTFPGTYQCDSYIYTLHRTRVGNAPLSAYGL